MEIISRLPACICSVNTMFLALICLTSIMYFVTFFYNIFPPPNVQLLREMFSYAPAVAFLRGPKHGVAIEFFTFHGNYHYFLSLAAENIKVMFLH